MSFQEVADMQKGNSILFSFTALVEVAAVVTFPQASLLGGFDMLEMFLPNLAEELKPRKAIPVHDLPHPSQKLLVL